MQAAIAVIDNLIGDGDMRRSHFAGNAAYCGDGDDLFDAELFKSPDIGPVIYFVRRDGMRIAVPGQEYNLAVRSARR